MLRLDSAAFIHKWNSKWSAQCGIPQLEQALAALPRDTKIAWENWPPRFTYPPPNIRQEVMEFAKNKNIQLELLPAADGPVFPEGKRAGR